MFFLFVEPQAIHFVVSHAADDLDLDVKGGREGYHI